MNNFHWDCTTGKTCHFNQFSLYFSHFFCVQFAWLPIVILMPALAFNQGMFMSWIKFEHKQFTSSIKLKHSSPINFLILVSGVDIHLITPLTCICCIFYSCVGGIKAVIYTDVVQSLIMFGAMFLVIIKGTIDVGGLSVVVERNLQSSRIEAPE